MFSDFKVIDRSFSVAWVGQINAPQTGDYTFFISPIDVNMGFSSPSVSVSITVTVAGQPIITASPPTVPAALPRPSQSAPPTSNWVSRSNAVTLTAGTPVDLQVLVTVKAPRGIPAGLLHAVLAWQGPGISRSLVSAGAFSQASGAPGLQGTYTWTSSGKQQTLSRVDPMIDFAWSDSSLLLPQDPTSANQLADTVWQAMTSTNFIASYTNATPSVKLHPFLADPEQVSCGLSTVRRQAFLDLLLQNPALLDAMDAPHAVGFFETFRVGTPDKALDVFGTWAARQPDSPAALATGRIFDKDIQSSLATMAILTTQQLPSQAARLQQEFLQLPDGRCSLPVAYTLTYSYLGRGKLSNWIATLDAALANPTLTGDLRVNWLLARARAQEFTRLGAYKYPFDAPYPSFWPIDSRPYLFQAFNAAQTPAVKARVAKEIAAHLTSAGNFPGAKDLLSQAANGLPDDQKSIVAGWQQQIDGFVAGQAQATQTQLSQANNAYLKRLQARRAQAASQGDSAAVSRYDALISAASSHP